MNITFQHPAGVIVHGRILSVGIGIESTPLDTGGHRLSLLPASKAATLHIVPGIDGGHHALAVAQVPQAVPASDQ